VCCVLRGYDGRGQTVQVPGRQQSLPCLQGQGGRLPTVGHNQNTMHGARAHSSSNDICMPHAGPVQQLGAVVACCCSTAAQGCWTWAASGQAQLPLWHSSDSCWHLYAHANTCWHGCAADMVFCLHVLGCVGPASLRQLSWHWVSGLLVARS